MHKGDRPEPVPMSHVSEEAALSDAGMARL